MIRIFINSLNLNNNINKNAKFNIDTSDTMIIVI